LSVLFSFTRTEPIHRIIHLRFAASWLLLTVPSLSAGHSGHAERVPAAATFYKDIAPIVYRNCSPCHRPGEAAPFSLLSYRDAKAHAHQIADVTKRHLMPPWLPESGYGEFEGERRLNSAQIQMIEDWVQQGSPAGSPADGPPAPTFTKGWQLGPPDLVIEAPKPFLLKAGGADEFWNFVLPLPIQAKRWVKAVEIRPGNAHVFHHANLLLDRSGSARRSEKSPGSGFPGMELSIVEDTFDPDSHFLFWKPGSVPWVEPDGMAWRADPGMDLVLNVHLQPSGKPELVRPSVGLYFTDHPQTKFPMLVQLEHDGAIDIPPGERSFLVSDDFRLPMDVHVLAVYPHAHYLGKLLEGYATLPDGTRKWLIRIPSWDLNWQAVYRFRKPIFLPKDTVVSMRFRYDNSVENPRNPHNPPIRVKNGDNATDEMGHLWIQVLPLGEPDGRMKLQQAIMLRRLEKYPGDFSAHLNLGSLLMTRHDTTGAIFHFERALQAEPGNAVARNQLGAAFLSESKVPAAIEQFKLALNADSEYTDARYNLANALANQEEWEPAAAQFRKILQNNPGDNGAREHLLEVLLMWGQELVAANKLEQVVLCYREALELRPRDAELHTNLGTALARLGRLAEAIPQFEDALAISPNLEPAKRNLQSARITLQAQQGQTKK
jgi:tetratricopeptide (TPR) repeat protein/mono/diheme cytochrome c family protein